jgi:N-acetylglucosaminyldiphosphoundecaprenol N-acetyl-beta-D-mannosaminyltransferase
MMSIIGTCVNLTSYSEATRNVLAWSRRGESRYICAANVHMLMEAHDSPAYRQVLNQADMITPDGMPLVWLMRLKGIRNQQRVYGPTLMLHVLQAAANKKIHVGFYGGSPETLQSLQTRMQARFSGLNIAYAFSPAFGEISPAEDEQITTDIVQSGVQILFVGLGCPKQERWIAAHRGKIPAVMLGVGAAFDFHAGTKPQAPAWTQRIGFEWLFRLMQEPGRLGRRYLYHNPRFVFWAVMDFLGLYSRVNNNNE